MNIKQEPKYEIIDGKLCNRHTKVPIPDDEPIFILRAKDLLAVRALIAYQAMVVDPDHHFVISRRIAQFQKFAQEHRDRMRLPDTHVTPDWDNL